MTITTIPALDRTSGSFKSDVDTFFGTQLPAFADEANALAADVNAKQATASAAATTAAEQAELATTNGAAQVSLAAEQAELATTQAALAATQAANASAAANFKGIWASLTGPLAMPATVLHASRFWALNTSVQDVTAATPGESQYWSPINAGIGLSAYDNRDSVRGLAPNNGDLLLIESLGLFRFYTGSTEPDDDETCFATTSGRWLLECPHWDVADAMRMADESAQDDRTEDAETRLEDAETRWQGRVLYGSTACAITSVAAVTQVGFTGAVPGASVGDHVLATPPNALTGRIACCALVSAPDTVTIYINNPSAAAATLVTGAWKLAVFKEI